MGARLPAEPCWPASECCRILPDRARHLLRPHSGRSNRSSWFFQGTADARWTYTEVEGSSSRSRPACRHHRRVGGVGDAELRRGPATGTTASRAALARRAAALGRYSPQSRAGLAQSPSTREMSRAQASRTSSAPRQGARAPKVVSNPDVVDQTRRAISFPTLRFGQGIHGRWRVSDPLVLQTVARESEATPKVRRSHATSTSAVVRPATSSKDRTCWWALVRGWSTRTGLNTNVHGLASPSPSGAAHRAGPDGGVVISRQKPFRVHAGRVQRLILTPRPLREDTWSPWSRGAGSEWSTGPLAFVVRPPRCGSTHTCARRPGSNADESEYCSAKPLMVSPPSSRCCAPARTSSIAHFEPAGLEHDGGREHRDGRSCCR